MYGMCSMCGMCGMCSMCAMCSVCGMYCMYCMYGMWYVLHVWYVRYVWYVLYVWLDCFYIGATLGDLEKYYEDTDELNWDYEIVFGTNGGVVGIRESSKEEDENRRDSKGKPNLSCDGEEGDNSSGLSSCGSNEWVADYEEEDEGFNDVEGLSDYYEESPFNAHWEKGERGGRSHKEVSCWFYWLCLLEDGFLVVVVVVVAPVNVRCSIV